MVDIIIAVIVFGYAGYALYRGIKKSRKGACAACSMQKSCSAACSTSAPASTPDANQKL